MATDASTLYKLIILYMLDRVNSPMTNAQISEFVLEKGYTTYFTLQEVLNTLISDGFITEEATTAAPIIQSLIPDVRQSIFLSIRYPHQLYQTSIFS